MFNFTRRVYSSKAVSSTIRSSGSSQAISAAISNSGSKITGLYRLEQFLLNQSIKSSSTPQQRATNDTSNHSIRLMYPLISAKWISNAKLFTLLLNRIPLISSQNSEKRLPDGAFNTRIILLQACIHPSLIRQNSHNIKHKRQLYSSLSNDRLSVMGQQILQMSITMFIQSRDLLLSSLLVNAQLDDLMSDTSLSTISQMIQLDANSTLSDLMVLDEQWCRESDYKCRGSVMLTSLIGAVYLDKGMQSALSTVECLSSIRDYLRQIHA
jgi:dsRNA-specific ribonuclease